MTRAVLLKKNGEPADGKSSPYEVEDEETLAVSEVKLLKPQSSDIRERCHEG